ncbi:pentapeptide repeat-containing protein [Paenibacillus daejeonensis]|uniref:pentapeptide repeat-containing protein n=1 Tax=Paenibacillus daejeonensis TaxID=135193 RepID=UPI000378B411|nr:pentapeptide repeat-containing protein [Paenibacillus daejeonensis]
MTQGNEENYRERLSGDCERCFGLCCIALPFAKSADFAMDKSSGSPCKNLREDYRCGIHTALRDRGFRGCTVYDCHGAGQHISQITYAGRDPLSHPEQASEMYELLPVMQQLHEMLLFLEEALRLPAAAELTSELRERLAAIQALRLLPPNEVLELDIPAHRATVGPVLLRVSELVRAAAPRDGGASGGRSGERSSGKAGGGGRQGLKRRGQGAQGEAPGARSGDYIGAKLRGADLRGANLRGALMLAADLRNADLRSADWIGADLRDADLRGADLSGSVFLTRMQLRSAKGDARTRLPAGLERPSHWD